MRGFIEEVHTHMCGFDYKTCKYDPKLGCGNTWYHSSDEAIESPFSHTCEKCGKLAYYQLEIYLKNWLKRSKQVRTKIVKEHNTYYLIIPDELVKELNIATSKPVVLQLNADKELVITPTQKHNKK